MKTLLITNIPNPYRIPLFNELGKRIMATGDEFKVIFAAEKYSRRKFNLDLSEISFPFTILGSSVTQLGNEEKAFFSYSKLRKILTSEKPDVIIVSGFSLATIKCWWYCLGNKCKLIIWSGSVTAAGKGLSFLRTLQRKFLVMQADAFVVYGSRAANYLKHLGANPKQIFIGINTVDTSYFAAQTLAWKELHVKKDNLKHLSYVGYLSPRKEVGSLLECIRLLSIKRNDFVVDIIGDGSDKENLENRAIEMGIGNLVTFHGFKQKEELPAFFAKTDCFLFQTGFDIWGLVLNEAMSAGLPCIVSPNAGAVDDLIKDGENGFVCKFTEPDKVIAIINDVLENPEKANRISLAASSFIQSNASIPKSTEGFLNAIQYCKE